MMKTVDNQGSWAIKNDEREAETRALEHYQRDLGLNYDAGFGSLLDDTAAADLARTRREHLNIED